MKGSTIGHRRRFRGWVALVFLVGAAGGGIPVASADTPVATVGSGGQSVLCINGQQSSVNPSSTGNANGLVIANSGSCASSTTSASPSSQPGTQSGGGGWTDTSSSTTTSGESKNSSMTTSTSAKSKSAAAASRQKAVLSVPAANAVGLKIAAIRYAIIRHGRLSVLVTIRDEHKRLVRNALVTLGAILGARSTLSVARSTFTSGRGQASFLLPIKAKMLGKRLVMSVTARSSHARAFTIGSRLLLKRASR
jgi:hypothetical protein